MVRRSPEKCWETFQLVLWGGGFQCAATGLKGKSLSVLLQAPSSSLPATFLFHSFSLGALCLPFLSCCWDPYWWVLSPRTRAQNETSGSEGTSWPESLKWIPSCLLSAPSWEPLVQRSTLLWPSSILSTTNPSEWTKFFCEAYSQEMNPSGHTFHNVPKMFVEMNVWISIRLTGL